MRCRECGLEIQRLPCDYCAEANDKRELLTQEVMDEFSLKRGPPVSAAERASLNTALGALKMRLDSENFRGTISFDEDNLLRSPRWWYVPYAWIGCKGFIVDIYSGYVNWLAAC